MDEDKVRVLHDEPDRPAAGKPPGRPLLLVSLGVVIGAVAVFVVSNMDTSGDETSSTATSLLGTTSLPAQVASTTVTTAPTVATSVDEPVTFTAASLEPLPGADSLLGQVALTPFPGGTDNGTLWVLRPGGSVVRRDDLPLTPGDYPYPLLMTDGHIAFANLESGYVIDADLLSSREPLTGASFVVPSSAPGHVWFVGPGGDWVALVDVASKTVGDRIEVADEFSWPHAGVADGLIVIPLDQDTDGRQAYWSPTDGLEPILLDNPDESYVIAASGDVAVVVQGDLIRVMDIPAGDYLGRPGPRVGDGPDIEACLSPDQQYVAVVASTGDAYIMEVNTGVIVHRFSDLHYNNSIGWTDPDQFVFIADTPAGTTVQAIDVSIGRVHLAARLTGHPSQWWLAADGTMC